MFVDDHPIIQSEKSNNQATISGAAKLKLNAGQVYRVRVEYHQRKRDSTARVRFGWRPAASMAEAVDRAKAADHIVLALGIHPIWRGGNARSRGRFQRR